MTKDYMRAEMPHSLRALARDLRDCKPVEAPTPQFLEECAHVMIEEYDYAVRLAMSLREQHWPLNKAWEPLPDLLGVLTQIDNMSTLIRDQKAVIQRYRETLEDIVRHLRPAAQTNHLNADFKPLYEKAREALSMAHGIEEVEPRESKEK